MEEICILLIDHHNVDLSRLDLKRMIQMWLIEVVIAKKIKKVTDVLIRTYGGWNCDGVESEDRFKASYFYQQYCPSLLEINGYYFRISFAFAEELLVHSLNGETIQNSDSCFRFANTVVTRHSVQKLLSGGNSSCLRADCEISKVRKWIKKKRACTNPGCDKVFSDYFMRREQKQVDMLLGLDFLSCITHIDRCLSACLMSNDLDFVPAVVMSSYFNLSNKLMAIMRTSDEAQYCDQYLEKRGVKVIKAA